LLLSIVTVLLPKSGGFLVWEIVVALLASVAFLAMALAIELVAPLYKVTWKSRLLGLQLTLTKAAAVTMLVPVLNAGWKLLGVQPISVGVLFPGNGLGTTAGIVLAILAYDFLAYWHHRFLHRFFWPVHATHHAIRELSALNS
jgi:sterol desaturase/sphingolipid hydroxylase (fatty acid hydroxylase superfamily)